MFTEGFCKGLRVLLAGPPAPTDALHLYHLHSSCAACLYKPALSHMMGPSQPRTDQERQTRPWQPSWHV